MALTVRIRRLRDDVSLPAYETRRRGRLRPGGGRRRHGRPGQRSAWCRPGWSSRCRPGLFLGIFARSSTPLKRGLMVANGVGVVDSDYCGPADEVKIAVMNFTAAPCRSRPATASRRASSCRRRA